MSVSSQRGQKIFDIDTKNFKIKGHASAYFKDNSLNITSGVPILIIDSDPNWIDICVGSSHPFYNIFQELSKDNQELYYNYFDTTKTKDVIFLRVNGENLQNIKQFCKLDIKVRILLKEEVIFMSGSDPEYLSQYRFLLDINKVEFL